MEIYILRHGKAAPASPGVKDAGRALTGRGKAEIEGIARWMISCDISFDLIATSPLVRAWGTAGIVADILDIVQQCQVWKSLSTGGDPDLILNDIARQEENATILLVGHEPALSLLISRIIAGNENVPISLAKGGLAKIRNITINGDLVSGELHWLLTPRVLFCVQQGAGRRK
jgi:phosphohistidine phosphatase